MRNRKGKPPVPVTNPITGKSEPSLGRLTLELFAAHEKEILAIIQRYDKKGTSHKIAGKIGNLTGVATSTVRRYLMHRGWTKRYAPRPAPVKTPSLKPSAEASSWQVGVYDHNKVKQMMEDFVSLLAVAELMAEKLKEYERLVANRYSKEEATP